MVESRDCSFLSGKPMGMYDNRTINFVMCLEEVSATSLPMAISKQQQLVHEFATRSSSSMILSYVD